MQELLCTRVKRREHGRQLVVVDETVSGARSAQSLHSCHRAWAILDYLEGEARNCISNNSELEHDVQRKALHC